MSTKFISWSIFIILCFIWGSSFILMRYSKDDLSSTQIAAVRIFSAGLVFLPFAFWHFRQLPRKKIGMVVLTGFFGNLLPAFLFAEAIARNIDSSIAGILNSLTPVCVVLISVLFFRDKISSRKLLGVAIGFAGLVLLTLTHGKISLSNIGYSLLIVVGTISYGINVNLVSHQLKGLHPVKIATVSIAFMVVPTAIILWQQGFLDLDFNNERIRLALLASAGLGIVGSAIATALFYVLVQKAGGLFASLVTYGIPFVALFWGFIYGEKVTIVEILCLGVILMGVWLANRKDEPETASKPT